jgi:hypothetical protein
MGTGCPKDFHYYNHDGIGIENGEGYPRIQMSKSFIRKKDM